VVLRTVIDKTGEVFSVNALSGPPLLESAAVEAVKQWQYRPYSMNGQPVDVETTVEVVFALDGSLPISGRRAGSRQWNTISEK
jgi:protein TonB